ncbi:SUF system Fe-S cluster assembly regulator [Arenimonas fontis]|uniref:SUF system Fe-S cluster assembly regulator n=1 Tax=Arenimonas fontis TaxID=2608255 RepID=A0A5B2ZDT9_9GAMM|nr:SUF system Fe-S cluster assembly regulator [Arenimonas fontis]KAA2285221.1 SUF system Fe-S cluster assembly regulator [Arenimonas fontis]
MLRVTKLTDYATLVLAALAATPDRRCSASELAEQARLEATTVAKVLKPLAHAGLVEGLRGPGGGYRLAQPATEITLFAIVEAIEGPLGMTECSGEHSNCELEPHCGVQSHWRRVNDVIADALNGITLAEMLPGAPRPRRTIPARLATV